MSLSVFVTFDGNCREAVTFYAGVFGQPLPAFMLYREAPEDPNWPLAPCDRDKVMYTSLEISGETVMFSDVPANSGFVAGTNVALTVGGPDEGEIGRLFHALSEGGEIDMPLGKTFFSNCFGSLTDRFGVVWQLSQD